MSSKRKGWSFLNNGFCLNDAWCEEENKSESGGSDTSCLCENTFESGGNEFEDDENEFEDDENEFVDANTCSSDASCQCNHHLAVEEKNDAQKSEILCVISNFDKFNLDCPKNPLLFPVVIDCVFLHLKLEEIKNLRFVCQEWNSVAKPLLRKRGKILFSKTELGPLQFLELCSPSLPNLPFTHFVFENECLGIDTMILFEKYGKNITSLKFNCVNMNLGKKNCSDTMYTKNIESSFWKKCNNLSELHIDCSNGTHHFIPFEQLINVKNLTLKNCSVLLKKDLKISPSVIFLFRVMFFSNMKSVSEFVLNEAFDFHMAKTIHIDQSKTNPCILDVGEKITKIEHLTLHSVQVINWEKSRWNVDYFCLGRNSLVDKITMGIKKLRIDNNIEPNVNSLAFPRKTIDLFSLPATLEHLSFHNDSRTRFICSDGIHLPNLKSVDFFLSFTGNQIALQYFTNCPNLVSISLKGLSAKPTTLDLKWLPNNIQKLEIDSATKIIDTRENAGTPVQVKKLCLLRFSFVHRCLILENIQADVLALCFEGREYKWYEMINFIQKNNQLKKIFVSVLPDGLDPKTFFETTATNPWSPFMDGRTVFYVFENQISKKITREEFCHSIKI